MVTVARWAVLFVGGCMLVAAAGCDDPKDPQTWIKQLRDSKTQEQAIRQLKKLRDPVAIEPLGKLFRDDPQAEVLKAIISFKSKKAVPLLIEALDFTEEKYHNASLAAHALAKLKAVEAVPALVKLLKKPIPMKSRANKAKVAAIEALRVLNDKKAVPALIAIAQERPEKQDFFLNKRAIVALGDLGDPEAAEVLVHSLFMASTLQGTSYPMARVALVKLGQPAVKPLLAAMQGKDAKLNEIGKELKFREGVVLNKTAIVLGDLRAKEAVQPLLDQLAKANLKETKMAGVIEALGKIGDPRAVAPMLKLLKNKGANYKIRMQVCNALTVLGDKRALPVLLEVAEKGFIAGGFYNLREAGAMAYGRLVGAEAAAGKKVFEAILADKELQKYKQNLATFKEAYDRVKLALECKDDAVCYGKKLVDTKLSLAKREKCAVMIGALGAEGRKALSYLIKALPVREPILRLFLLQSAMKIGTAKDTALIAAVEKLWQKDRRRKTKFHGADLASADAVALANLKRQ